MSIYDSVKDAVNLFQKADNIDLYKKLLDIGSQALDMQDEIRKLKEENAELKRKSTERQKIIRHRGAYITLEGDEKEIPYCALCYGKDGIFIQMVDQDTTYGCYNCRSNVKKDR